MDDLIAFLRARLDDDARQAAAASPGPWSGNAESDEVLAVDGITVCDGFALSGNQLRATVAHIARHDPARVLREVEAKRRIIAECIPSRVGGPALELSDALGEVVLLFLALPYSDHPDYREEWAP